MSRLAAETHLAARRGSPHGTIGPMTRMGDLLGPEPVLLPGDSAAEAELAASENPAIVAAAKDRALELSAVTSFASTTGMGVRGIVEERQIAVGNRAPLASTSARRPAPVYHCTSCPRSIRRRTTIAIGVMCPGADVEATRNFAIMCPLPGHTLNAVTPVGGNPCTRPPERAAP